MASYQVEGCQRHQETSPVQPNSLGLFVDIEVRLPPRRPLSTEIREHRGPVNPIPLRQLIDTRASETVSLQLVDLGSGEKGLYRLDFPDNWVPNVLNRGSRGAPELPKDTPALAPD